MALGLVGALGQTALAQPEGPLLPSDPDYFLTNYKQADYGPGFHPQNWSITQDDRGFIYVANSATVLQYDGIRWRSLDGLDAVRVVQRGPDGQIYVGAYDTIGYLAADSTETLQVVSLVDALGPAGPDLGEIRGGAVTSAAVFWYSRQHLVRWDGERMQHLPCGDGQFARLFVLDDTL